MTTIVYKDGIIAYDSFATSDGIIVEHNFNKKRTANGVHFFFCGSVSDIDTLILGYFGEQIDNSASAASLVVDGGSVYVTGIDTERGVWIEKLDPKHVRAIGSGADFALTAMDMGADAKTAVKMAAYRDMATGGKIKTFRVF